MRNRQPENVGDPAHSSDTGDVKRHEPKGTPHQ